MSAPLPHLALLLACAAAAAGCAGARASGAAQAPAPLAAVDPRFEAALLAAQRAVRDGDDLTARSILDRLRAQAPEGEAARIAARLDEVLAGREAMRAVSLALRTRSVPAEDGATMLEVWLETQSVDGVRRVVRPSALSLEIDGLSVDAACVEKRTRDAFPLPLADLQAGPETTRLPLWRGPWGLAPGAAAGRVVVRLEARAGRVLVDGRDLPAQRIEAAAGFAAVVEAALAAEGPLDAAGFLAHARQPDLGRASALRMALRVPPALHDETLAALGAARDLDLDPVLEKLVPAARWLCGTREAPSDAAGVRALAARLARPDAPQGRLVLPGGG